MKKAFTLIELLVVIAIIAILAAMLMPALTKARSEAQKAVCSSNVHNLGLGWAMFRKDHDGEWTREQCMAWDRSPEVIGDIGGLGYVNDMDVYLCPSLDSPYERKPTLVYWYPDADAGDDGTVVKYADTISQTTYFADEARITKEPLEQRAILADGIELMTLYGAEPANHANEAGRATGANALFVDMAVEWQPVFRKEHPWTLAVLGTGSGVWPDNVNSYGYTQNENWYPSTTGGTWKRYGYIQNNRLLASDPNSEVAYSGRGEGEDDIDNGGGDDVDDIYYVDPTAEQYTEAVAAYGFISYARGARCIWLPSKSDRDCSLAGGHIWWWRKADALGKNSAEYDGYTWGWPEEVVP
jgi:prepilin-type N-terminal cleavage/methylation domain-containing protein